MVRIFYTTRDIEDMVASGVTTLEIDESVVVTDEAKEKARKLCLKIKKVAGQSKLEQKNDYKTATWSSATRLSFYTVVDIVQIVEAGNTQLEIDENDRLTDEAVEKARKIGLKISRVQKKSAHVPGTTSIETIERQKSFSGKTDPSQKPYVDPDLVSKIKSKVIAEMKSNEYDGLLEIIIPMVLYRMESYNLKR